VRLLSLRLQNFRQHADTVVTFDRGLTGIIGPNGAGKSTLLEAIAFALYGTAAARGTRDSIRFSRAAPRAAVKVELVFELAGHRYRVVRGLTTAECFLDGGDVPVANTLTGVTELLQRRLGMTRTEFFHTYFTGQKELDVMATLGPAERARFLSRVLGYDRITAAQELARERRRALVAELAGMRAALPDAAQVAAGLAGAEAREADAAARLASAQGRRATAAEALARLAPAWEGAQQARAEAQRVEGERRALAGARALHAQGAADARAELARLAVVRADFDACQVALAPLAGWREALRAQEAGAQQEARRGALRARLATLAEAAARDAAREAQLASAPALEAETEALLGRLREAQDGADRALAEARTAWARDRQEAETRLESITVQYREVRHQHAQLEALGAEGPCPTCGRPLGATWQDVLAGLEAQVETLAVDGHFYRQRMEQLAAPPEGVTAAEQALRPLQQELLQAERRMARIRSALHERDELLRQRGEREAQQQAAEGELAALAVPYDGAAHAAARAAVEQLAPLEAQRARLVAQLEREGPVRAALARAEAALAEGEARERALEAPDVAVLLSPEAFEALRREVEGHQAAEREAELAEAGASAARREAAAAAAAEELTRLQAAMTERERERQLHDELDRALGDLRTDLNHQLRPELAEVAGRFLDGLTDGRYAALEFDEDYRVVVLEDGLPKPVLSGGEEDLCNLVLRLAISQMIAERAGQAFSLLILDEVFGSLDDVRRTNVVELLRRLHDRFEQVIVITHVEGVRDGLDRVLQLHFDEARGCTTVRTADPGAASDAEGEAEGEAGVGAAA
jgi:exonuclease SbcC